MSKTTSITLLLNDRWSEMAEGSPCCWTLMFVEGVIKEHIQEDAQRKNLIPDMIGETASHFQNVIPWTDSLEASQLSQLGRIAAVSHWPPATGSSLQEMVRTRSMRSVACRRQTGALPMVDTVNEEIQKGSWRFMRRTVSVRHTFFLRCWRQWDHATT